jgi:hypothetical protein
MTIWYAVLDGTQLVSIGSVIDQPAVTAKGWTTRSVDVPDGKVAQWNGTTLVATDPPPVIVPKSLEQLVDERVDATLSAKVAAEVAKIPKP